MSRRNEPLWMRLKKLLPGSEQENAPSTDSKLILPEPAIDYEAQYRQNRDRGLQELATGRVAEAIKTLARAARQQPQLGEAHWNLGRALQQAGRIEAARAAFQRARDARPPCTEAQAALEALPPPPPARKDFSIGQRLACGVTGNRYRVRDCKHGGFGAVYIVADEATGTPYALKTFQARYLWSDTDRERFEREAVTWVVLDRHPHIVAALWMERIEGFPCLTLEYVPGGDLEEQLQRGPLPLPRALELALQFCDGMAYAHDKLGIVHRDIKPSNCLLTADGALKIADFGLARAFGAAREAAIDLDGFEIEVKSQFTTFAGTLSYMAPEQFRPEARLDTRTDIHAFGVMLYQMLTKGVVWEHGSVAYAGIQARAHDVHLPKPVLELILHCVETSLERRPRSFHDVRQALAALYRAAANRPAPAPTRPFPMGVSDLQNKGVALLALGFHKEAVACYDGALQIDAHDASLWKGKAAALHRMGQHSEALLCCDKGLAIAPNDSGLQNNRGLALAALGRLAEAVDAYEHGLQYAPHDPVLLGNLGDALLSSGRIPEAIVRYDQGLVRDAHNVGLLTRKGYALLDLADYAAANDCFGGGLRIAPHEGGLWKGQGMALHALANRTEAIVCYRRGLEIAPNDSDLHRLCGLALLELGRAGEALVSYDNGLKITQTDNGLWKGKGVALCLLERAQEAIPCFMRALEIAPNDSELHKNVAAALNDLGRPAEALPWTEKGLAITPNDPYLWRNKGMALLALNRAEEAATAFQCGLEQMPEDPHLWQGKSRALEALGQMAEAEACRRRAEQLAG